MPFYDDSILSGTKTLFHFSFAVLKFYDDSILSGTKTIVPAFACPVWFYDDSILSGTKTIAFDSIIISRFMMTQFFQVLKHQIPLFT